MKYLKIIFLFGIIPVMAFSNEKNTTDVVANLHPVMIDTMPEICSVVTPQEIDAMNLFNNGLVTKYYSESYPVKGFHACYYEFDAIPHRYGMLSVQLQKTSSKKDANDIFWQFEKDHHDLWGVSPERILYLADSAAITINENCADLCWECVLIVKQGVYVIWVSFKAPDDTKRERMKTMGIRIVNLMYDRIPGLAPQVIKIRN